MDDLLELLLLLFRVAGDEEPVDEEHETIDADEIGDGECTWLYREVVLLSVFWTELVASANMFGFGKREGGTRTKIQLKIIKRCLSRL